MHQLKYAVTERRTEFQIIKFPFLTEKAGEMAQRLRAHTVMAENLSSVPSTHGRQLIITYNS
ncbi:hypothetical protein ACRRTK_019079 [Alexandromys fortis]